MRFAASHERVSRRIWLRRLLILPLAFVSSATLLEHARAQAPAAPLDAAETVKSANAALKRGVEWLVRQQGPDGGWHSATYGQMRGGVGDTAVAIEALSRLPAKERLENRAAIDRGMRFLTGNLDPLGFVRGPTSTPDFPIYATALTLSAMERLGSERWPKQHRRMRDYLLSAQQNANQGWKPTDADFGGWHDMGGGQVNVKLVGAANVSVTSLVLQALQASGSIEEPVRNAALAFLTRCQNVGDELDGGFGFLPDADDPLNKAGWFRVEEDQPARPRSYGTTSADGSLALLALGLPVSDTRLSAALGWLQKEDTVDVVPGIGPAGVAEAREGLKFYYYAALARLAEREPTSWAASRRHKLLATLIKQQQPDGSWRNAQSVMREDDPLVSTPLAIAALATLLKIAPEAASGK